MTKPALAPSTLALVALGGALGAVLRWSLGVGLPDGSGFPWTTFAINVGGAFALALLPLLSSHRHLVHAIGPGLLGGFTTLSAYAEQGRALMAAGSEAVATAYLVGTLGAALVAIQLAQLLTTGAQRRALSREEGDQ